MIIITKQKQNNLEFFGNYNFEKTLFELSGFKNIH